MTGAMQVQAWVHTDAVRKHGKKPHTFKGWKCCLVTCDTSQMSSNARMDPPSPRGFPGLVGTLATGIILSSATLCHFINCQGNVCCDCQWEDTDLTTARTTWPMKWKCLPQNTPSLPGTLSPDTTPP